MCVSILMFMSAPVWFNRFVSKKKSFATPVAFSELRLTGRENATYFSKKSGWRSEVADRNVNVFLKYPTQVSLSKFVLQELLHLLPLV